MYIIYIIQKIHKGSNRLKLFAKNFVHRYINFTIDCHFSASGSSYCIAS